jgi:hypothetical protein
VLLTIAEVTLVRARIATARAAAAQRFREVFTPDLAPTAHLELQANALLEATDTVRVMGRIRYAIDGDLITPYVEPGKPIYEFFDLDPTPLAVFEYWMIVSEIIASPSWAMTRVIATSDEYNDALRRIDAPQLVRVLHGALLPDVELRDDGTAMLDVTVYTRADEERVERRSLFLDAHHEFHFHGRELIAEGKGGVRSR